MALPSDAVIEQVTGCRADQVKEMQDNVTTALDHDTGAISAVRVLHLYLERLLINFEVCMKLHVFYTGISKLEMTVSVNDLWAAKA